MRATLKTYAALYSIGLLLWLVAACSVSTPISTVNITYPTAPHQYPPGWHTVSFHLAWQRQAEPEWSIGTQLAGETIAPLLSQWRNALPYWRIHRRAADDAAGHTFSWHFYSTARSAELIYAAIAQDETVQNLKRSGQIISVQFEPLSQNNKPKLEDTSDPKWPSTIRKTWPRYIMGVSEMWLEMVLELKRQTPVDKDARVAYQKIHAQLTQLWQQHGQHAWLHHLNAVYGYSPVGVEF